MNIKNIPGYWTQLEIARHLGIDRKTAGQLIKHPSFPGISISTSKNKIKRWDINEVKAWEAANPNKTIFIELESEKTLTTNIAPLNAFALRISPGQKTIKHPRNTQRVTINGQF